VDEEIIEVRVTAGAREHRVVGMENGALIVKCRDAPEKGKANKAVIELLAKHFGVPKRDISIVFGKNIARKLVKIQRS